MILPVAFQRLIVIEVLFLSVLRHGLIERRHGDIDMSLIDQLRHKPVEQGQEQGGNVGAVHVRIRHDNDLVVAELRDVEIIAVSFGKSASECIDHRLDLCVCKDFVDACLLHIEDLSADWKDRLIVPVPRRLGRTAGGVTLYDEDLAFLRIAALTVGQFAVAVEGIFLLRQQIGLRLLFRLPDLRRFLRTGEHRLQRVQIPVEIPDDFIAGHFANRLRRVRVVQLGLRLPLKPGIRMFDRDNRSHSVPDIRAGEICILFLQDAKFPGILVHYRRKCGLESGQMRAAFGIIDIVAEAEDVLVEFIDILERRFHFDPVCRAFKIDRLVQRIFLLIQISDKSQNPIRLMVLDMLRLFQALIVKNDLQLRIQVRRLVQPALHFLRTELRFLKDRIVGEEVDRRPGLFRFPDRGQQTLFQFNHRNSPLIPVMMDVSFPADPDVHISGQRVHHRGTNAVKSAACLIGCIIELSACMECGKYKSGS